MSPESVQRFRDKDMHKYKNLKQIACIRFHAICFGPAAEMSVCSCALPWPTYICGYRQRKERKVVQCLMRFRRSCRQWELRWQQRGSPRSDPHLPRALRSGPVTRSNLMEGRHWRPSLIPSARINFYNGSVSRGGSALYWLLRKFVRHFSEIREQLQERRHSSGRLQQVYRNSGHRRHMRILAVAVRPRASPGEDK